MPYILASQHPVVHSSCIITSLIMQSIYKEHDGHYSYFETESAEGKAFVTILTTHIVCLLLHAFAKYFKIVEFQVENSTQYLFLIQFVTLIKLLVYLIAIVYVQTIVLEIYDDDNPCHLVIWLLYEVLLFYYGIFALIIFLFISRFRSFKTIRERAGHGSNLRYNKDFLSFVKDDIHWFTVIFQQLFLCAFAIIKRKNLGQFEITGDIMLVLVRHFLDFIVVYRVFFKEKKRGRQFQVSNKFKYLAFMWSIITNVALGVRLKFLIQE